MGSLSFFAKAPSNIALIKYMGKKDSSRNLPENSSLSMTLDRLCTYAEITRAATGSDVQWIAELPRHEAAKNLTVPQLSDNGRAKVLRHVQRSREAATDILTAFGLAADSSAFAGGWELRSANTFPQGSGIASSASSFAAVTLASILACAKDPSAFCAMWERDPALRAALARLARLGSGSACRSLDGPFVLWSGEDVEVVKSGLPSLAHFVVLVSATEKKVSSSNAHLAVKTSPLWNGRASRAEERVAAVRAAIAQGDLAKIARISWNESWEMHSLFHTCAEPFTYWEPKTVEILQGLSPYIAEKSPPIVTLDAGPNIHVIVESAYQDEWEKRLRGFGVPVLRDGPGRGAQPLFQQKGAP